MNLKELKEKSLEELLVLVNNLRRDIFKFNTEFFVGKSTKSHLVVNLKKDLARVITLINEKRVNE